MTPDTGRRASLGLALAVFSGATFGTSGPFAESLMHTGWTPGAVVTFRIALAALLLTGPALIAMRGKWSALQRAWPSVVAFGLVAVAGCQLLFFSAVQRLDVGVALLLEYCGVLFVVLWMWLRHGQRPRRLTVIGGAAAIVGLVLVLNPSTGGVDPLGVFWALLAAVGLAVYFVLSSNTDVALPPIALAWATLVVGAVVLAVADLVHIVSFHMETADVELLHTGLPWFVPIIGVALLSTALGYASGIAATRKLGARLASFIGLTEVLFAVIFAWALLGQAPGALQIVGGLVVLAGIALVRADDSSVVETSSPIAEVAEPARA